MKSFQRFLHEARTIRSKEDAEKMRQEKDNPDDWIISNKGGGHWHPVSKEKRKGQAKRRGSVMKSLTKQELEDHGKRNLQPNWKETAKAALKIERARKRAQRSEAQKKSKETGQQHDVDHISGQKNRKKYKDRSHRIHPGDASDNRRVISQADNLVKNSKDPDDDIETITRAKAIRMALDRARHEAEEKSKKK